MLSSYFTIQPKTISIQKPLPFSVFINSSSLQGKGHFVRVIRKSDLLKAGEVDKLVEKYHSLYLNESERDEYFKFLATQFNGDKTIQATAVKNVTITYLSQLFDPEHDFTTAPLKETVEKCREAVEHMVEVVQDQTVDQLRELISKMGFHDFYTLDHSMNVSMYCISFYKKIHPHATKEELTQAGLGGLLHDIGKIKISTAIINWPEKLTEEQFAVIKSHPENGRNLLCEHDNCFDHGVDAEVIKRVVFEHHENFNGTGYPRNLKGETIHQIARMVAICDFFDALTTKRSYHEVMQPAEAIEIMRNTRGKKLDPVLFDAFESHIKGYDVKVLDSTRILAEDFDPCQPHKELPFIKNKQDYGKIKILEKNKTKSAS